MNNTYGDDVWKERSIVINTLFRKRLKMLPTSKDVMMIQMSCTPSDKIEDATDKYISDTVIKDRLNDMYQKVLHRTVDAHGLKGYTQSIIDGSKTWDRIEKELMLSPEYKGLMAHKEYIKKLKNRKVPHSKISHLITSDYGRDLKVKYYGPVGTTGYSVAAMNYVNALFVNGCSELCFSEVQIHTKYGDFKSERELVRQHLWTKDVEFPDIVVIHSVPDMWEDIIKETRASNPSCKIIGLTVWEANKVHDRWIPWMNLCDAIITPCCWNTDVFSKALKVPVHTVKTPVESVPLADRGFKIDGISDDEFVFYTINEWNPRKGLSELMQCFVRAFTSHDNVTLFIKSSPVCANPNTVLRYIETLRSKCIDPPKVIIKFDNTMTDEQISAIHKRGQCYISLAKAEGTGLGAVEACLHGKPVIMSGYGGSFDYLKGVFYISTSDEKPNMCDPLNEQQHLDCGNGICNRHFWYAPDQLWGKPLLDDAVDTMRFVQRNYSLCTNAVNISQHYIRENLSYSVVGKKMIDVFREVQSRK